MIPGGHPPIKYGFFTERHNKKLKIYRSLVMVTTSVELAMSLLQKSGSKSFTISFYKYIARVKVKKIQL